MRHCFQFANKNNLCLFNIFKLSPKYAKFITCCFVRCSINLSYKNANLYVFGVNCNFPFFSEKNSKIKNVFLKRIISGFLDNIQFFIIRFISLQRNLEDITFLYFQNQKFSFYISFY